MRKWIIAGLLLLLILVNVIFSLITRKFFVFWFVWIIVAGLGLIVFTVIILNNWKLLLKKKTPKPVTTPILDQTKFESDLTPITATEPSSITLNQIAIDESKLPSYLIDQAKDNRYDTYGYIRSLKVKYQTDRPILSHRPKFYDTYQSLKILTISKQKDHLALKQIATTNNDQTIPAKFHDQWVHTNFFINPKKLVVDNNSFQFSLNSKPIALSRIRFQSKFINQFKKTAKFFTKN